MMLREQARTIGTRRPPRGAHSGAPAVSVPPTTAAARHTGRRRMDRLALAPLATLEILLIATIVAVLIGALLAAVRSPTVSSPTPSVAAPQAHQGAIVYHPTPSAAR